MKFKGRKIVGGKVEGEVIVFRKFFFFFWWC